MVVLNLKPYRDRNGLLKECRVYYNVLLLKNLKLIKPVVLKKDFDYVCVVTGKVGLGKSVFAQQIAKFFDEDFTLDKVCFSADEFIKVTTECPKGSAVILDESFESLNTKVGMSPDFLKIINHLSIIRQRNLFLILVLPDFFDLNKTVALNRSHHLFYVYGEKFGDRGDFEVFSSDNKRMLYIKGGKFRDYRAWKPNFRGHFSNSRVLDRIEYENKKKKHLQEQLKQLTPYQTGLEVKREIKLVKLIRHMNEKEGWSLRKIGRIIGMFQPNISDLLLKYTSDTDIPPRRGS